MVGRGPGLFVRARRLDTASWVARGNVALRLLEACEGGSKPGAGTVIGGSFGAGLDSEMMLADADGSPSDRGTLAVLAVELGSPFSIVPWDASAIPRSIECSCNAMVNEHLWETSSALKS